MKAFWDQVNKTNSCWLWTGPQSNKGYGVLEWTKVHRLSYQLHKGKIPKGLVVRHSCDNKLCVNPEHLELGTYSQNLQEAYDRGLRQPKASQRESVRLSGEQVKYIQSSPLKPGTLARRFQISTQRIRSIKKGVTRLPQLDIDQIRADQGTIKELAQKYHLSKQKVALVRKGIHPTIKPVTPELMTELHRLAKVLIFNGHPNYSEIAKRVEKSRKWVKRILHPELDEV